MGKVRVEVSYLPGVEDPEAITITKNLHILGFDGIKSVKISKVYEFDVPDRKRSGEVAEVARKLLCNEVIQGYNVKEE
ncbi:MAG: phosphoribosylformylglycinamidine synthase subunit PurS [Thermoplasmataceae archaeon]